MRNENIGKRYRKNLRVKGCNVYSYNTHVATIDFEKRILHVHGYWSMTTSKHTNYIAQVYALSIVKGDTHTGSIHDENNGMLKTSAMVASFANVLCDTTKDKNDWKMRMLKAGLDTRGLDIPKDWDTLPESVKEERLNNAINAMSK